MRWLERLALRAVLPAGGPLPGIEAAGLDAFLERFHREAPVALRAGLLGGALVILVTPPLTVGRPLPANLLAPATRDRHVQRLAGARCYPVRQAVFAVKMVAGLCWGADPAVRAALGLAPLGPDPGTFRGDDPPAAAAHAAAAPSRAADPPAAAPAGAPP